MNAICGSVTQDSNPEGINQYSGGGGEHAIAASKMSAGMSPKEPGKLASEEAHISTMRAAERNTARAHEQAYVSHTNAGKEHRLAARIPEMHQHPEAAKIHNQIAQHYEYAAKEHFDEAARLRSL
jgi:hypothetical protein